MSTNFKEQLDSLAVQVSGFTCLATAHIAWLVADIILTKSVSRLVVYERRTRGY
ncbi:Uncharacterised protein [Chlamydia trachomatis]|nr:Uncharacterised protein [Chlamydia trachomatis]